MSRDALPKQFLPLVGERSTYQDTLLRVADDTCSRRPIVITGSDSAFSRAARLKRSASTSPSLIEPMRRDSGPALAAGAALAPQQRSARRGAGACRRSRHPRPGRIPRGLPCRRRRRTDRPDRDLRHHAERAEDQLRLYPPRPADGRGRGLCGRGLRRKARCRDRRALCRAGLPVELRQLPVPRRRAAGRAQALRAGHGGSRRGRGRGRQQRSRVRAPCARRVRPRARRSRSTMR